MEIPVPGTIGLVALPRVSKTSSGLCFVALILVWAWGLNSSKTSPPVKFHFACQVFKVCTNKFHCQEFRV